MEGIARPSTVLERNRTGDALDGKIGSSIFAVLELWVVDIILREGILVMLRDETG